MNSKRTKPKSAQRKPPKEDKVLRSLGARIKELRIRAGYTSYEKIAYENDISRAQWGRYENGQDLRFSTLIRLTKAFNISLEEFFSEGFE